MIVVSVLHYGDVQLTISCVLSILEHSSKALKDPYHIIISNNGTQEEQLVLRDWSRKNFESVTEVSVGSILDLKSLEVVNSSATQCFLIYNGGNLGFSAGYNPAVKLALTLGAEAIWFLNNDARIKSDALSSLWHQFTKTQGRSIIGTTVVDASDPSIVQCAGGMLYNPYTTLVTSVFERRNVEEVMRLPCPKFDYIYGASMLVPCSIFKEVGFFNEDFFLFYEEIDFCKRASAAGYSLSWCKRAVVQHREEMEKGSSSLRIFHDVRSFTIFARKHYASVWLLVAVLHASGRCFVQLKNGCFSGVITVWKGFLSGLGKAIG